MRIMLLDCCVSIQPGVQLATSIGRYHMEMTMSDTLHKLLLAALFCAVSTFTVGCNTIEGIGEDTEAAGDAIDEEAEEEEND
jgi:predicted small secreted protein